MFKNLLLGNFKAFGPTQRIPIRPLTLIFGPNSSGKSSLIHGLLLAHEAQTSDDPRNLDVTRPRLGGDSVDLGGFRQFVHKKNIESRVEWGVELDAADLSGRLAELLAPVKTITVSVAIGISRIAMRWPKADPDGREAGMHESVQEYAPQVQTYQVSTDQRVLLRASVKRRGDDWWMGVDELDGENPVILAVVRAIIESSTTTESLQDDDFQTVQQTIDDLVPSLSLDAGQFIPRGVERASSDTPESQQATLFPISRGNRQADLRQAIEFYLPRVLGELIGGLETAISQTLHKLRYLGPLRSYPPRHLAFAQYHDPNWNAGGGYAWDRVRHDSQIRERVNDWLSSPQRMKTPYQIDVRPLLDKELLRQPAAEFVSGRAEEAELHMLKTLRDVLSNQGVKNEILEAAETEVIGNIYEELIRLVQSDPKAAMHDYEQWKAIDFEAAIDDISQGVPSIPDLVLIDVRSKTAVSHRDVGIGVSQVLPVLVAAFAADGELVAIEQPEIHLHPALQSELGDVFISAALSGKGNAFLLETHSEHLILRIMRRIRETTNGKLPDGCPSISPEDVAIIYVEPDGVSSIAREMPLNELGELVKAWPGGFFEEGLQEIF